MIAGLNKISGKTSVASVNRAEVSWERRILGSKKHLDWFKIDFNAAEKITIQGYKRTRK